MAIGFDEVPRYNQLLEWLTGQSELAPPGLIFEVDRPEWHYLARSKLWSFFAQVGAVAAKVSCVQIKVTGGSNVLSVVQGVMLQNPLAGNYRIVRNATRLGGGTGVQLRDLRTPAASTGQTAFVGDNSTFAAAPTVGVLDDRGVPASQAGQDQLFVGGPYIVGDGKLAPDQLSIFGDTVNQALNVVCWGYERFAKPEELGAL